MRSTLLSSILLAGTALAATPALADDAPASPFTITGSAAVATQYRFRGISQSNNRPVVQGAFTVSHSSGFYISTWGSSATGNDFVNIGGTEIDVYGGWTHGLGKSGVTVDVGGYGYLYPGAPSGNYFEIYGSLSKSFGPIGAKIGAYWAPKQKYFDTFNTATKYNMYEYFELSYTLPMAPVTLHGHVGHSGGGFDTPDYTNFDSGEGSIGLTDFIDYNVGVGYKWKALTFDVSYVGTNISKAKSVPFTDYRRDVKPVFVGSITASF